ARSGRLLTLARIARVDRVMCNIVGEEVQVAVVEFRRRAGRQRGANEGKGAGCAQKSAAGEIRSGNRHGSIYLRRRFTHGIRPLEFHSPSSHPAFRAGTFQAMPPRLTPPADAYPVSLPKVAGQK